MVIPFAIPFAIPLIPLMPWIEFNPVMGPIPVIVLMAFIVLIPSEPAREPDAVDPDVEVAEPVFTPTVAPGTVVVPANV